MFNRSLWILIFLISLFGASLLHASSGPNLVLLPLDISESDAALSDNYGAALQEGLSQRYKVFYGQAVEKQLEKEYSKLDCTIESCQQNVAIAFNGELIVDASVTKIEGGYLIRMVIRNVITNEVVESISEPCEGCNSFSVIRELKEIGRGKRIKAKVISEKKAVIPPPQMFGGANYSMQNLDLSDRSESDFVPRVRFDLKNSKFAVSVPLPEGVSMGAVAQLNYSLDGNKWENGWVFSEFYIEDAPEPDTDVIHIKIRDGLGNSIGPYQYRVDYRQLRQDKVNELTLADFRPKVEFNIYSGWRIVPDPRAFFHIHYNLHYSWDGKSWEDSDDGVDFFILGSQLDDKVFFKYSHLEQGFETPVITLEEDFEKIALSQMAKKFRAHRMKIYCRKGACRFQSASYIGAVKSVSYSIDNDKLDQQFMTNITKEQLGSREYFVPFQEEDQFEIAGCGSKIYYQYHLVNGKKSKVFDQPIRSHPAC